MKRSVLNVVLSTALLTSLGFGSELVLSGTKVDFQKRLSLHSIEATSTKSKDILTVVHTKNGLSEIQKDVLYGLGVQAIKYAGVQSYYILADASNIDKVTQYLGDDVEIALLKPEHKISNELKNININDDVRVVVTFMEELPQDMLEELFNQNDIEYKDIKYDEGFGSLEVTIKGYDLETLADMAQVKEIRKYHKIGLIKPFSSTMETKDISVVEDTKTDEAIALDTDLNGLNIPIGMVDEGKVLKTHQEFTLGAATRIRDRVNGSVSVHSTHVAGILGASGIEEKSKGMASAAQIYSFTYNDVYFAQAISVLAGYDILLTNHSYGFVDKVDLGAYNSDAANEDSVIYGNPYVNMFIAAGNDRGRRDYPETMLIKGAGNAKNVFTIGALDFNSEYVAYYSSAGPAADGRIKPDLVVKGTSVYSTSSSANDKYLYMSGTSMATPAATGIAALVMQEYKDLTTCDETTNKGCDMRADVLKAVLINTAVDKNATGPDIYTGYGMINAKEAIETVKTLDYDLYPNMQEIKLDSVAKGDVKTYPFSTDTTKDVKITVSWVDPAGNSASSGRALVNDLNVYVKNKNTGKVYYPYSLNKDNPKALAYNDRENHVDNTEKVEMKNLPAGDYELVVEGDDLQTSSQDFAIVSSELMFKKSESVINSKPKVKLEVNNFAKIMLESIF